MKGQNFKYPECNKGGCHIGEVLNMICLDPKCIQKSVICGMCYDEEHRNHKIRPLKVIINNSKKYLQGMTPLALDSQKVKSLIKTTQAKLITSFDDLEKFVKDSLANIRININAIFSKVLDQVELKTGKNDQLLAALEQVKEKQIPYATFVTLMQKLIAGVPHDYEEDDPQVTGNDIERAVTKIQTTLQKDLKERQTAIKTELEDFLGRLQKKADNPSIFDGKPEFKFSNQLKHAGITLVNDTTIKSTEGYNYHFSLMEPALNQNGVKPYKVAFKIKENTSSWLAVGVCYKNSIVNANFTFNYSALGHGAYLISSNGGSWSSIDAGKNNQVTSFNFYKNDVITVEYDPVESKIVYRKKGTEQNYTIEFQQKQDDELHLCGLFYYSNDQIEYLGYDE